MLKSIAHSHCETCGDLTTFPHDHQNDLTGLDDGPWIFPPRNKPTRKTATELRAIRKKAWATRRTKYGSCGHR